MDVYICSKPLQFHNAYCVSKIRDEVADLIIIPSFNKSSLLFEEIEFDRKTKGNLWRKTIIIKGSIKLFFKLFFAKYSNIYADADCRLIYGVLYFFKRFNKMFVYEEGFGTYRTETTVYGNYIQNIIKNRLGIGKSYGESLYCHGVWVYFPDLFLTLKPNYKNEIFEILPSFIEGLRSNSILQNFFNRSVFFKEKLENSRILIYASSWDLNDDALEIIDSIKHEFEYVYLKPHPNMKNVSVDTNIRIIEPSIMLEHIIDYLLHHKNDVTVLHENSTSVLYFEKKIKSINLNDKTLETYEVVKAHVQNV